MQPPFQAHAAAQAEEEAEAHLVHLGPYVLLNDLIFAQMCGHLDRGDKRQLRDVCRDARALADSNVKELRSRGKPASVAAALALWPLQRLNVDCDAQIAAVISAATLPRLRVLNLEHTGGAEWSVPILSRAAAAGLWELHLAYCYPSPKLSIEAVVVYTQLRTLSLIGSQVVDLTPLQGCANLQILNIHCSHNLKSLEGLQACRKLERLDMNTCRHVASHRLRAATWSNSSCTAAPLWPASSRCRDVFG